MLLIIVLTVALLLLLCLLVDHQKLDHVMSFVLLLRNWVVERSFGWSEIYWRLSKDYEYLTATSVLMNYMATIHIMAQWIEDKAFFYNSQIDFTPLSPIIPRASIMAVLVEEWSI